MAMNEWSSPSLAEKPKVGELQMDWLRSEDLKEEKNVTASTTIIAAPPLWRRQEAGRLHRAASDASNRSAGRRGSRPRSESGRKVDI